MPREFEANHADKGNYGVKSGEEKEVCSELEDLLLPYAAESLTEGERAIVEKHLRTCSECSRELEKDRRMTEILCENEEVLCPDPVELYEYANFGEDPTGLLDAHLALCPRCRAEVKEFGTASEKAAMPEDLWNRIRIDRHGDEKTQSVRSDRFAGLRRWFSSFRGFPALALGTAAAIVLMVAVFLPRGVSGPEPAFSGVTWLESADGLLPKRIGPAPPGGSLAVMIYLSGFRKPVSRERIDELYRALKPDKETEKRFRVIRPVEMTHAFQGARKDADRRETAFRVLKDDLGAANALILTVGREESGSLRIDGEFVNIATGVTVRRIMEGGVKDSELPSRLRRIALSLLTE